MAQTPGEKIMLARLERDWTLRQLADKSNVDATTISKIETGKQQAHGRTLFRLAKALGLDPAEVLEKAAS